ncbi:MAG: hypothetical protein FWB77_02165 [Treponema sp.]|nr:hypothetical protein [Treponema sp.]
MTLGKKSAAMTDVYEFSDIVDKACEGLKDRQIKYSIRRIHEMEEKLSGLERELDAFINGKME